MAQHALVSALKEFDKNSWLLMGLMFFAKPELRATYFGAFNLSFVGAGLAPLIGGMCLTVMSSQMLYSCFGVLYFIVIFCLLRANQPLENKLESC